MKTKMLISTLILILAVLIIAGSCATKKEVVKKKEFYFPKYNEELYGTWINKEYDSAEYPGKFRIYLWGYFETFHPFDSEKTQEKGTFTIVKKWTDQEGNIWYNTYVQYSGSTRLYYNLEKISNNGNTWEYVTTTVDFPTESDMHPEFQLYHIYYRQE
jgi:hypothetical protein